MNTTMNLQCVHCDETYQINLNYEDVQAWKDGTLIQDALPYLNADSGNYSFPKRAVHVLIKCLGLTLTSNMLELFVLFVFCFFGSGERVCHTK